MANIHGVVFVVDSTERLDEAKTELWKVLNEPAAQNIPIVVLGNKVDKHGALLENDFREILGLTHSVTSGKETAASMG